MASFLLLHGGQHGPWCWDAVRSILESHGHLVETPDLPGAEGRPVTLDEVADAAARGLERLEALRPRVGAYERPVVVAHSMGGMAAVLLADRHRARITGLLCAAAVVPQPGVPVLRDAFGRTGSVLMGALGRPAPIRAVASYFSGHRLSAADRRALLSRLRPEDLSRAGVPFPHYDLAGLRCLYVLATRDRLLRPAIQARFAARLPGGRVIAVDGGHSVPIEHPTLIAEAAETLGA
ncbi:MAG: alpha/beta hydrolase [Actinomycetota bacterium]|jgi:pimeloyl-ACP methyl ester carboxylesterase